MFILHLHYVCLSYCVNIDEARERELCRRVQRRATGSRPVRKLSPRESGELARKSCPASRILKQAGGRNCGAHKRPGERKRHIKSQFVRETIAVSHPRGVAARGVSRARRNATNDTATGAGLPTCATTARYSIKQPATKQPFSAWRFLSIN